MSEPKLEAIPLGELTANAGLRIVFVDTIALEGSMRVQVRKWGNSLALRIPKLFAHDAGVGEGTVVQLSVSKGRLIAVPIRAPKARLQDLLAGVTKANLHGEFDTGRPVGREVW